MTVFNSLISRADAEALIPPEVSAEIIKAIAETNPLMQLARRLPDLARSQRSMPVMSALAHAYFVSADTGMKQTTEVNWENKTIYAEEVAAIVPIPEAVLDDSTYDIWGEVKASLVEAFGQLIAQAVLYGTSIPANWTTALGAAGILAGATAASQVIALGSVGKDLYDDLFAEGGVANKVEEDGFMVSGHLAAMSLRAKLRGLRDDNGQPIFKTNMQDPTRFELDGSPLYFPADGSIDAAESLDIAGDWRQLVYAMRQDVTYKLLDQAVITNGATPPVIIYNLAQQDMVALRAVMRLGFALPNPINRMNDSATTRYPFAVLAPAGS